MAGGYLPFGGRFNELLAFLEQVWKVSGVTQVPIPPWEDRGLVLVCCAKFYRKIGIIRCQKGKGRNARSRAAGLKAFQITLPSVSARRSCTPSIPSAGKPIS